ncbi:hypothetical protein [Halobacillus mangrovi]|uniref:hypothetical protein n=1 Tax=Halobacillus mangrovi TaxID=402384 RepID=UPI003D999B6A
MYKLNSESNRLEKVLETTFFENDLKEREHIQEWIRKNPEVLGEELLLIGCEYDKFEISERIDLLGIDKEGNVSIIELKRDTTGGYVDFQALKYASYCARLSPSDLVDIYSDYITSFGLGVDAKESLVEFLELEDEEELHTILNTNQRIIIVGKEIDKRILSVCTWLYENGIDVKCITLKPYKLGEGHILVDTNQIIPPFKLEDYYINKKEVKKERQRMAEKDVREFLQAVSDFINTNTDYTAKYGGVRSYFKGHKFIDLPWRFVFAYKKKNRTASMFVESFDQEAIEVMKYINENYLNKATERLGTDVSLVRGEKNASLFKLVVELLYTEHHSQSDQIDKFNETFVKFKSFLEDAVKEYNNQ